MGSNLRATFDAPLLVLYSKMHVEGKLRALLIVSLWEWSAGMVDVDSVWCLLDFIPNFRFRLVAIPNADDILVWPHANGATAYPRPLIRFFICRWLEIVELFSKNGEDNIFP